MEVRYRGFLHTTSSRTGMRIYNSEADVALQERKRTLRCIAVMYRRMATDWLPRPEVRGEIRAGGLFESQLTDTSKMAMYEYGPQKPYIELGTAHSTNPGS
jgi:hypothetical protein